MQQQQRHSGWQYGGGTHHRHLLQDLSRLLHLPLLLLHARQLAGQPRPLNLHVNLQEERKQVEGEESAGSQVNATRVGRSLG